VCSSFVCNTAGMSELPAPKFRKTKSEKWAVMAPVETLTAALANGGIIEVQKKSGDWSKFSVASMGKPFDVDGVAMAYGYAPDDESDATTARPARGSAAPPPPRDTSEPLPVYQGGPEDEWQGDF
jgi:hypothetical protein